jgi:uncharacterized protein
MGKFVFWVGVFALIWLAFRLFKILQRKHLSKDDRPVEPQASGQGEPNDPAVPMLQCAHCGLYLPRHEGVAADGRVYCPREHRDAGPSRQGEPGGR